MAEIELAAGIVEYQDSGGDGPVLVLLHGLLMDCSLWADPISELPAEFRCVAPTLPLGAHRRAMTETADLSMTGIAGLVAELLERLDLWDVTLVGIDTGGALVQLLACDGSARIGAIVLASCDAFDNFPPGLTGKSLVLAGRLPPSLFGVFLQQLRFRLIRRLPIAFGTLTKRGDAATARWIKPSLGQSGIRRDTVKVLRGIARQPDLLIEAAGRLPTFTRPALVVWAGEDMVMPAEHGRRLAAILHNAPLVKIADSYTLMPLDQPAEFARALRTFINHLAVGTSDPGPTVSEQAFLPAD